jgi:hypothetical protein
MNDYPRKLWNYRYSFNKKKSQSDVVIELRDYGDHKCSLESYRKWESGLTIPNEENQAKIEQLLKDKG